MEKPKKYRNKKIAEKQKEFGRKPIYDAYYKSRKTVESCLTTKQLESAHKMVQQFNELYGDFQFTRSILGAVSDKAIEILRRQGNTQNGTN